jgi:acetolactate synthase I/III small subunit
MKHTILAQVEDKPGVLNRVASLFRRSAFNIESLAVGHSELEGISRMTIVLDDSVTRPDIVVENLYKLVNVLFVEDLTEKPAVFRETALIKVSADAHARTEILSIVDIYRARIVDVANQSLVVEITGDSDKIESMLDMLRPFGILEMVRTGRIAISRGRIDAAAPSNGYH